MLSHPFTLLHPGTGIWADRPELQILADELGFVLHCSAGAGGLAIFEQAEFSGGGRKTEDSHARALLGASPHVARNREIFRKC